MAHHVRWSKVARAVHAKYNRALVSQLPSELVRHLDVLAAGPSFLDRLTGDRARKLALLALIDAGHVRVVPALLEHLATESSLFETCCYAIDALVRETDPATSLDDVDPDVRGEAIWLLGIWRQAFNERQTAPVSTQLTRLRALLDVHEAALPDDLVRFLRFYLATSSC